MEMTNHDRAERALSALLDSDCNGSDSCDVTDLLADLMHFCKREEFDFEQCLYSARNHFEEEVEEEA